MNTAVDIAPSRPTSEINLPDSKVSAREAFGNDIDMEVPAFSVRTEHVPDIDTSYKFDRETTMAIAFGLGGVAYWLLVELGTAPWAFVLFAALIFLTWGEIFSLFPSTCTDTFGTKFATVNLSLLYTAKGTSAFLVPVANLIKASTGSWHMVFVVTAVMNLVVVALALFVLKPLRARTMRQG